ncbi:MAG: GEVED domain-containing protein [Bacteroidetes bacterium]|nr:GEVED domain-containing protein [Bacteroidota bacterium]
MKKMYNFRKTVANVSRHARSLSLLLVMGLLFVPSAFSQVVNNSESFDGATFVPTGWTNFLTSGTNTWTRVTTGTTPTCTPHSGAAMAKFNSYTTNSGVRSIITPVIDLSGRGATATNVSFWMYRDNNATYASTADKIDVLYNTAANVTGATLLGSVNRSTTLAPVVATAGWYQYTFAVPAGFTGTTNYLIIRGTSAWGDNIFVDDVAWQSFLLACTGTPAPGNTLSSLNPVCSGASFMLSLQNATTGSGVTYQWQSSADGITYANIGGATLATYSTTQTSATFYQCIVTCTVSGLASTSTFINVPMNPFYLCSCTAIPSSTADEEITNVTVGSLNNSSTCATVAPGPGSIATRYGNYMSGAGAPAAPSIVRSSPTSVSVTVGSCGSTNYTSGLAIFMDLNHNGSFADAGEKVYSSGASASINNIPATVVPISITIPGTATLGVTAMRVISDESTSGDAITPCIVFTYGETEDYLVNIVDLPPTPPTPTQSVAVPSCSSGTDLSVAGSPAVGDAWYWQTTALGTSLSTPVSGPYTVFVNGIYYVRAYNAMYSFWSAASSSITVSNIPVAPLPPTPTAVTPACLSTSLSVPAASGSVTFYWQGTTAGGTSASLDAASPYIATTSGTYYVAAYDASTSCWSNTNGLAVVIDTYVPATPTTTTSSLIICQGSASAIINAGAPSAASLTATFGTGLISPGTATNFNITVPAIPAGATITSTQLQIIGANAINGSWRSEIRVALSGSTTLTATQISALSSGGLITPDPSITVPNLPLAGGPVTLTLSESYDDGGVDDASFTEIKLVIAYTLPASTITWWNAATVGTQVGTGSPFETVGTTLLPTTATPGTYTFYAQAASGACLSSPRLAIPIIVNPVLITINPINVLCNGGSDGSFSLGTVTCGVGPFTYSVNGGAFGVIPTNLTAGTYAIIAKDSNGDNSSSISLTVTEPSWTVPNAVAGGPFSICQNAASEIISVTPGTVAIPQTVTVQFALAAQPADGAYPGALIASATMPALPAGAVVTSATLYAPGISTNSGSYETEFQLGLTGSVNSAAASGTGAIFGGGIFNYTRPVLPSEVNISGGALDLLYYESYDDYAGAADANFTLGASSVTLTITYTPGTSITWFDASTGGTSLGTGSTLETVGTSVLPTTATPGTYNFYAEGVYSGCTSPARTLVTVTVNALPVVTASSSAAAVCSGTAVTLNGGGALTYVWDNSVTDAIAFTPSATTTYNVIGTDGNGCTNTASAIVTVNDLPIVAATSTPVLCNGGSSTITVTATSGSPAYVGEGSFTQLAGTVVYTVTDANSCAGTTSVSVTEPTAIVTSSSSTAILCNAGTSTVTISATGGTGSFTGTGIFTQAAGTIVYTVTDANSCPSSTSVAVTEPTAIVLSSSETGVL